MERSILLRLQKGASIRELPLRVTFYARVSTDKDEQKGSLSNQITHFEEKIRKNPSWTFVPGYVDEGLSGTSVHKRESFLRMIADARSGLFDLILTKEISRFSRSTLDSIQYTQELLRCGVGVFFQSDNINTLMPDAELRLTIMASIAQDEVRRLSERLKFGYRRAVQEGRVLGQDNMWGYDKKQGHLTINEEEAETVRQVFCRYAEGKLGLRAIARQLEQEGITDRNGRMLNYGTLYHMLKNPKYKGWYAGHKTESPDYRLHKKIRLPESEWVQYPDKNIPAIVSEELWDAANDLLRRRGERMRQHGDACGSRYPYSGKIFCGLHEMSYHRHVYKNTSGQREVWNCKLYREKGRSACKSPTLYTDELNEILSVITDKTQLNKKAILTELLEVYRQELGSGSELRGMRSLNTQMESISRKKETLLELYAGGHLSGEEFARRNKGYTEDLETLSQQLDALNREQELMRDAERQMSAIAGALDKTLTAPYAEQMLSVILDKAVIFPTEEENTYHLEVHLRLGGQFRLQAKRERNSISFSEIGISQAQVSRLEKNAITQMKKYL